jgi:hypothetical protein
MFAQRKWVLKRRVERRRLRLIQVGTSSVIAMTVVRMAVRKSAARTNGMPVPSSKYSETSVNSCNPVSDARIKTTGGRLIQNETFALVTKRVKVRGFMGLSA